MRRRQAYITALWEVAIMNKFQIGDKVFANNHLATIKNINGNRFFVTYDDGKGADYMPIECLKLAQ